VGSAGRILATVVGSYPTPAWLAAQPSASALRDAVMVVLKTQELAGLDLISDGELSRFDVDHPETNGMIEWFTTRLDGIAPTLTRRERAALRARSELAFRKAPGGVVRGPVGEGRLDLAGSWDDVRGLTTTPMKFTVTSPYMLARSLADEHYGDARALAHDLAVVLAEQIADIAAAAVQVDEAELPGHPEDIAWAHEPINQVLDAVRGTRAVHVCFGNYGAQRVHHGSWDALLGFLDALHADVVLLELARDDGPDLARFRGLRPGLGLGAIDVKDLEIERPEVVARRIEAAATALGADAVRWVHPDCGLWMLPRSVADGKLRALVAGRDLFAGVR
jgi:5-methyltetrahydropteroyltriglutamate--homocysteine methyltransferase